MKELKEFTVERLERVANTPEKYDHRYLDNQLTASEARSLAKIALAVKQTKPVAIVVINKHTDEVMLDISDEGRDLSTGDKLYTTPPLNHTEQDEYWYEVECYKYKGPARLCAGNTGPAWYFPGSDLLVDNDEVKVIGRTAAPKPESE